MTFEVHVLASGSDGNCSVLEFEGRAVMIDAGISYKKIEKLMDLAGVDSSIIEGIVITHEHSDHVMGAERTSKMLGAPIYCNCATFMASCFGGVEYKEIKNSKSFELAGMKAISLPTSHRAADPCGYFFTLGDKKFLYATDTGMVTYPIEQALKECDVAVIESNYDRRMLIEGSYPQYLKAWVDSDIGHLCNTDCGEAIRRTDTGKKRKFFLAHLSKNNNTPDIARDTVSRITGIKRCFIDSLETPLIEDDTRIVKPWA